MTERASTPSSICLWDPQERDEAVAQEGAQNSAKKGVHFGTHRSRVSVHASHEVLTLHSPVAHPSLTLLARRECLKRHGVDEREGELGANLSLPSPQKRIKSAEAHCQLTDYYCLLRYITSFPSISAWAEHCIRWLRVLFERPTLDPHIRMAAKPFHYKSHD
jgi:hypothetical protein